MNAAKTLTSLKRERGRGDRRTHDNRASSAQRGYSSPWQRARLAFLKKHPLCVTCRAKEIVVPATVVDHIIPHKGNKQLFWDSTNWQGLCELCSNTKTAKEDGGFGNKQKLRK